MSEANFPSGQWVGFYTYTGYGKRFLMDLMLTFRRGLISGEGADGIGLFGVQGRYYPREGECFWTKTYFGRHSVQYTGHREQKGIWGTWTLPGAKGGFHIWPIGDGTPLDELREEVEKEFPLDAPPIRRPLQPLKAVAPPCTGLAGKSSLTVSRPTASLSPVDPCVDFPP